MKAEIEAHLARADELLLVARELVQRDHPADAVSRSYYAMFHAATAVLLKSGVERSSHKGVISAFGEFIVKPGHLLPAFHASLRRAFEARIESDYLPTPSDSVEMAEALLREAEAFVAACRSFLEST